MAEHRPDTTLLAGTSLRLVRHLGEGAHGVVYEAEQLPRRRRVVVKLLRHPYSKRGDIVDRLRVEARAVAAIGPLSRYVVPILEHGRALDGRAFIVMERLEGRTLREEIAARGALPVAEAADIACQLLDGLAAAHDAGVVHRDVKPDNVFLCTSAQGRRVKLLDFGIAGMVSQARAPGGPAPLARRLEDGAMPSSRRFCAPEQARGEGVTPSSDLYAAAAVLYTMLAGRDPFHQHGNMLDLMNAHLFEQPRPPSEGARHPIPEALDRAVLTGLAKRPEDRFPSARAFRSVIERGARSGSRARLLRLFVSVLLASFVVSAAGTWVALRFSLR